MSTPIIGTTLAKRIRITNTRPMLIAESYCHASAGIQPSLGFSLNLPTKRARNDQSGGRPITPMNPK